MQKSIQDEHQSTPRSQRGAKTSQKHSQAHNNLFSKVRGGFLTEQQLTNLRFCKFQQMSSLLPRLNTKAD